MTDFAFRQCMEEYSNETMAHRTWMLRLRTALGRFGRFGRLLDRKGQDSARVEEGLKDPPQQEHWSVLDIASFCWATGNETVGLETVVGLFDRDRPVGRLERFFTPAVIWQKVHGPLRKSKTQMAELASESQPKRSATIRLEDTKELQSKHHIVHQNIREVSGQVAWLCSSLKLQGTELALLRGRMDELQEDLLSRDKEAAQQPMQSFGALSHPESLEGSQTATAAATPRTVHRQQQTGDEEDAGISIPRFFQDAMGQHLTFGDMLTLRAELADMEERARHACEAAQAKLDTLQDSQKEIERWQRDEAASLLQVSVDRLASGHSLLAEAVAEQSKVISAHEGRVKKLETQQERLLPKGTAQRNEDGDQMTDHASASEQANSIVFPHASAGHHGSDTHAAPERGSFLLPIISCTGLSPRKQAKMVTVFEF